MSKTTVRINLWIEHDFDSSCPQLRDHTIQISYSKIDHPCLARVAEITGLARKWCENCCTGLLHPWCCAVIARRSTYAKRIVIPYRQDSGASHERIRRRFQLPVP